MTSLAQAASWIAAHEVLVRGAGFVAVFGLVAAWELRAPARIPRLPRRLRWTNNLALVVLNTLLLRLLFPAAAVGVAAFAADHGWGVLNHLAPPPALAAVIAIVALDFAVWLQHVMVHAIPLLWRVHRVHHADPDYDLTTGARFHPIEIVLSMLIKFAVILVLGPPVVAVILFEVLLNASALFNHGNVRLPARVETVLRWFLVTPDMHRVHHSIEADETNTNFGFTLSCWDRLLGTYRPQPRAGHRGMIIGIHGHDDPREVSRLPGVLALPFRGGATDYAIGRAGKGTEPG